MEPTFAVICQPDENGTPRILVVVSNNTENGLVVDLPGCSFRESENEFCDQIMKTLGGQ